MAKSKPVQADVAQALALAMISSSTAPLLLISGGMKVIAASASFCSAFGCDTDTVRGREIFSLGKGEWDVPQLRVLLEATASGSLKIDAYEMDIKAADRSLQRLVINAQKLEYGPGQDVRLLVTVCDVTALRLNEKKKDDLLREKAILLQEVQHRVANSLQIIASVILQSARKTQSEDTRMHLHDAHSRVMSVATLQQQLASQQLGEVALRPYLIRLCQSIGASMIHDTDQVSILVDADDGVVAPDVSISLGLIVTELVINCLKHAFPDGRKGRIVVSYASKGSEWTLAVSDDGVGMPMGKQESKPGLGTSIVEALAKQLEAELEVGDRGPGTLVTVIHSDVVAMGQGSVTPIRPAQKL